MDENRQDGTDGEAAALTDVVTRIKSLSPEALDSWTDIRMVGRGYGMVDRVSNVLASSECVSAKVHGSAYYVTSVFSSEDGKIDSRCTCPVRHRCKHAVALMLKVQRALKSGEELPTGDIPAEMDARLLVRPFGRSSFFPWAAFIQVRARSSAFMRFWPMPRKSVCGRRCAMPLSMRWRQGGILRRSSPGNGRR